MSNDAWQLSLVLAGGVVALVSSLLTTWLTSRLADRKALREKLDRLHELRGKRRAMLRESSDGDDDVFREWFKLNASDPARLSFMVGFLEKNSTQIEAANERAALAQAETARLKAETAELNAKTDMLKQKHARLERVRDAMASRLERAEQELAAKQAKAGDDAVTSQETPSK